MLEQLRPTCKTELLSRFGRKKDGGYVLPSAITGQRVLLVSCGIEFEHSFEKAIITRTRASDAYLYDHSSTARHILRTQRVSPRSLVKMAKYLRFLLFTRTRSRVHFVPKYIGATDTDTDIDIRRLAAHASPTDGREYDYRILKLDIEANEYTVLTPGVIRDVIARFDIIAIELHQLPTRRAQILTMLDNFRKAGFFIGHFHNNNCTPYLPEYGTHTCFELTLLHTRAFTPAPPTGNPQYPAAKLDYPSCPKKPETSFRFVE